MNIEPAEFRRVLGHFATGVTIVTSRDPAKADAPVGLTVSAFSSLSLDPPLVLVCIEKIADSHDAVGASRIFAVNVLDESAERLSWRFATADPGAKFDGLAYREESTGAPILDVALAWVDCRVEAIHDGGDHTIFIGAVIGAGAHEGAPLVYYRGEYRRLGR